MVAIQEALLPSSGNCSDMFQGQSRDAYGAALASGLQWMYTTWEGLALVGDLLVGLCGSGSSVISRAGFHGTARYNVELLS